MNPEWNNITDKTIESWRLEYRILLDRLSRITNVRYFLEGLKNKWYTMFINKDNLDVMIINLIDEIDIAKKDMNILGYKIQERQKKIYDRRNHIESEHIGDVAVNYKRKMDGLVK